MKIRIRDLKAKEELIRRRRRTVEELEDPPKILIDFLETYYIEIEIEPLIDRLYIDKDGEVKLEPLK